MKTAKMKICKTCKFCKRLYRNYCGFFFEPEKKFYCIFRKKIVKSEYFCEKWQKKLTEIDLSAERFDEAFADLRRMIELLNG